MEVKIAKTKLRLQEFYEHYNGDVYIAYSGGKDSTVLLHIARSIYPNIDAVFIDTGLEFPEIKEFVSCTDNVITIRPKKSFVEVLNSYGYPVVSKSVASALRKLKNGTLSDRYRNKLLNGDERGNMGMLPKKYRYLLSADFKISERCCDVMKKNPAKAYTKRTGQFPVTGEMACDSALRENKYLQRGCNSFTSNKSTPLGFWTHKDIDNYVEQYNVEICSIYDTEPHTGCMFCMFGVQFDGDPNRFQRMKISHPKIYEYCMTHLGLDNVLDYMHVQR